jgi:hypothetical protein
MDEVEAAVRAVARQAQHITRRDWDERCAQRDTGGTVTTAMFQAIAKVCTHHGYRTHLANLAPISRLSEKAEGAPRGSHTTYGATLGWLPPGEGDDIHRPKTVQLQKGMSRASTFRVACHETGHVILGHPLSGPVEAMKFMLSGERNGGGPQDEVAVELAAGAVCQLAGIGSGRFSPRFIREQGDARFISEATIADAVRAGREIWSAVAPQVPAQARAA